MKSANKESLDFIKKYKRLCEIDPKFEDIFMRFFEAKIIDYQKEIITSQQLDEDVCDFIDIYQILLRDKKIKSLLRKKQ